MRHLPPFYEAVLALRDNPHFQTYLKGVSDEVETLNERLVLADLSPHDLTRLQGEVRFGVNLLKQIEKAGDELMKSRQPRT